MLILNRLEQAQHVRIVLVDGSKDSVTLQPRGGRPVRLPEGAQLDPEMLGVYVKTLRTEPKIVLPSAPADTSGE